MWEVLFTPRLWCHSRDFITRFSTLQKSLKNIIVRPNGDHGSAKIFLTGKHGPCTRCDSEEKRQPAHRPPWRLPTLPPAQSSCQQQCQRVCRARGRQRLGHRPCRSFQKGSTRLLTDTTRACDVRMRSGRVARMRCYARYWQRLIHRTTWGEAHANPPRSQPSCHAPTPPTWPPTLAHHAPQNGKGRRGP